MTTPCKVTASLFLEDKGLLFVSNFTVSADERYRETREDLRDKASFAMKQAVQEHLEEHLSDLDICVNINVKSNDPLLRTSEYFSDAHRAPKMFDHIRSGGYVINLPVDENIIYDKNKKVKWEPYLGSK